MKQFNGKVVMITGGNRGIGLAIAQSFAEAGASLALGNRSPAELEQFNKDTTMIQKVDMTVESDIVSFVEKTRSRFGRIDVLINNAGVDEPCSIFDVTLEHLSRVMHVNFFSVVLLTKLVSTHMKKSGGGRILNISSIAGKEGTMNHTAYSASKHAVIGFTKCAARELIPFNIYVNCICPGLIETRMLRSFFDTFSVQAGVSGEESLQEMIDKTPLGRVGTPSDVANLALFLASDDTTNILGQAINIDGGYLQH